MDSKPDRRCAVIGRMHISLVGARELLTVEKVLIIDDATVADLKSWLPETERHKQHSIRNFRCRVRERDTLPRGLWFRAIVWQRYQETSIIQLDIELPDVKGHQVLYRLEVKPHSTHINGNECGEEFGGHFFDVGVTHEHSYLHDARDGATVVTKGVSPCAIPIGTAFRNFEESLQFACDRMNITDWRNVPPPPLQLDLV